MERQKEIAGGEYRVQVAMFRTADEAVEVLEHLMSEGYDGTVLSGTMRGEVVHYVQLGPYVDEDRAQQVARDVRALTGLDTLVLVEP
jgi:cell division septation protein DedD